MATRLLVLHVAFHLNISSAAGNIEFRSQSFGDDRLPIGRIDDSILKSKPFLRRQRGLSARRTTTKRHEAAGEDLIVFIEVLWSFDD